MSIKRYKLILKKHGVFGYDMAERLDLLYTSYRSVTRNKRIGVPKWLKAFLIGYDMGRVIHIEKHTTKYKRAQKAKRESKLKKKNDEKKS